MPESRFLRTFLAEVDCRAFRLLQSLPGSSVFGYLYKMLEFLANYIQPLLLRVNLQHAFQLHPRPRPGFRLDLQRPCHQRTLTHK